MANEPRNTHNSYTPMPTPNGSAPAQPGMGRPQPSGYDGMGINARPGVDPRATAGQYPVAPSYPDASPYGECPATRVPSQGAAQPGYGRTNDPALIRGFGAGAPDVPGAAGAGQAGPRPGRPAGAHVAPHATAEENPYSRRTSQRDYTEGRKKDKRRKTIGIVIGAVVALVVLLAAGAWAYMNDISNKLNAGVDDELLNALGEAPAPGEPFYMLLMGVDKSEDRAADPENGDSNFRSDSMILARIDPPNKKVTLISLHRDTMLDMGEYGTQKLNAAHQIGGAAFTVKTVSKFAGVPIKHYAEIDFDSFRAIVDALGGVEVDVPMEINDEDAWGHLQPGLQTLNGDEALTLARARHAYDEYGDGDVYRAANQRMILGAIAKKVLASDLPTIAKTVKMASEYIVTDMSLEEVIRTAQTLRGMDTSKDIYSIMEPTSPELINGTWYENVNEPAWRAIMKRVDQGLPPVENEEAYANNGGVPDGSLDKDYIAQNALSPESVKTPVKSGGVEIRNGNGVAGAASVASDMITAQGLAVSQVGNADSTDYAKTIIVYNDDSKKEVAQTIANTLGTGMLERNSGSYTFDGDFLVILGKDF